jgi:hypothetical protein
MLRTACVATLFALVVATASSSAAQQMAPAPSPVKTKTTAVNRIVLWRVLPGQGAAFNQDVMDHLIPIYEEYKKAGIITDYRFFSKTTADSPDDWTFGVTLTFANFAALDNATDRADPIQLKHYGSADKRTAAVNARNAIRTVVSSFLTQTTEFSR